MRVLGLDFFDGDADAAARLIADRDADAPFAYVVTPNADHFSRLARDPALLPAYQGAWLRLLDSRVVARARRLLGQSAPTVATGSDLTAALLAGHLRAGERVTIIGVRADDLPALVERFGLSPPAHLDPPMGFDRDARAWGDAVRFRD